MTIQALLSQRSVPAHDRRTTPSPAVHSEEIGAPPAGIAAAPGGSGAQLHDVLALVQRTVPTAVGLAVRGGQMVVAYSQPPDDAARAATRTALADQAGLAQLASHAAAAAATANSATPDQLRAQLLDATLADDAWLRAFRRYQVALLSAQPAHPDTK